MSADFVSGATMAAALVIAVIFFRYWRQTRDRLFLGFALGFAVFADLRRAAEGARQKGRGPVRRRVPPCGVRTNTCHE